MNTTFVGSSAHLKPTSRRSGIVYMLLSALAASSSGIFVRLVEEATPWQVLSLRSLAFAGLFILILYWRYRRALPTAFLRIGWLGLASSICLGLTYIAYLASMFLTSIASAVIIFTLSPFFAAVAAALFLKEWPRPGTWLWMLMALAGVSIMLLGGATGNANYLRPRLGMLIALGAAIGYAVAVVILRGKRDRDLRPSFVLAGIVAFGLSSVHAGTLVISPHDAVIAILLGVVSLGLQYLFLERAARHLQADEITLLALIEVFISPLWVWIGVGEVPALSTLIGGCVVIMAVAGLSFRGFGEQRRRRPDDSTR